MFDTPTTTDDMGAGVATPTDVPNAAAPNTPTAQKQPGKGSLSGLLLPIGGAGVLVLLAAGALIAFEMRRRQAQRRLEIEALAARSSTVTPDSWAGQQEVSMLFGQSAPQPALLAPPMQNNFSMLSSPAQNDFAMMPVAEQYDQTNFAMMPPAMQEVLEQPTYMDMHNVAEPMQAVEDQHTYVLQEVPLYQSGHTTTPMQDASSQPQQTMQYPSDDMRPLTIDLSEPVENALARETPQGTIPAYQSLQDDAALESMIEEAQMGIFLLPAKKPTESLLPQE